MTLGQSLQASVPAQIGVPRPLPRLSNTIMSVYASPGKLAVNPLEEGPRRSPNIF